MSLEELVPSDKSRMYSIFIRTGLVLSTLVVGLCVPFFGKSPLNILHWPCYSISTIVFTSSIIWTCRRSHDVIDRIFIHNACSKLISVCNLTTLSLLVAATLFTNQIFLLQALILPCACYLSILKGRVTRFQVNVLLTLDRQETQTQALSCDHNVLPPVDFIYSACFTGF